MLENFYFPDNKAKKGEASMKKMMFKLEELVEVGGMKKDIVFLVIGGVSLLLSLMNSRFTFHPLPFDIAWLSILFFGIPNIL